MLTSDVPVGQILVKQIGTTWQVWQRDRPVFRSERLDEAIATALAEFRDRRGLRMHIMVLPSDNPNMWD